MASAALLVLRPLSRGSRPAAPHELDLPPAAPPAALPRAQECGLCAASGCRRALPSPSRHSFVQPLSFAAPSTPPPHPAPRPTRAPTPHGLPHPRAVRMRCTVCAAKHPPLCPAAPVRAHCPAGRRPALHSRRPPASRRACACARPVPACRAAKPPCSPRRRPAAMMPACPGKIAGTPVAGHSPGRHPAPSPCDFSRWAHASPHCCCREGIHHLHPPLGAMPHSRLDVCMPASGCTPSCLRPYLPCRVLPRWAATMGSHLPAMLPNAERRLPGRTACSPTYRPAGLAGVPCCGGRSITPRCSSTLPTTATKPPTTPPSRRDKQGQPRGCSPLPQVHPPGQTCRHATFGAPNGTTCCACANTRCVPRCALACVDSPATHAAAEADSAGQLLLQHHNDPHVALTAPVFALLFVHRAQRSSTGGAAPQCWHGAAAPVAARACK